MPGRPSFTALALAVATVAGCVTGPDVPAAPLADGAPAVRTLWFTGAPGLSPAEPTGSEPERVRGGGFFTTWGRATGFAEFVGEPSERTLLVTGNATLVAYARTDAVATQAGAFPHFIAYFGTDAALNADGSADAEPVMLPGGEIEFEVAIAPPAKGFLIEKGARPRVLLVAVMTQTDATDVAFLVNATATPARVEFTAAPIADPAPLGAFTGETVQGTLVGSAYARAEEGTSRRSFPVAVPAGSARVDVTLSVETGVGFTDLDLAILDAGGNELARGVTPYGLDRVILHPLHFGEGATTLTAVATQYGSAASTFSLDARVYAAANAP